MWEDIDTAILNARFDDKVTVILVTGKGNNFFSAGASINYLNSLSPRYKYFFCLHANETLSRLEQTPKLVIAALNGHTVGGGLEIAACCDIRICGKSSRFGIPIKRLGLTMAAKELEVLLKATTYSTAMEILFEGRVFDSQEALEKRLVNRVVNDEDVMKEAYKSAELM